MFANANTTVDDIDTYWILDSGASYHLTLDGSQVHNDTPYASKKGVMIGNYHHFLICSIGNGSLCVNDRCFFL